MSRRLSVTAMLDGELAIDFECLHAASGAPRASLVRQALREFIDDMLRENKGLAQRFAQEKRMRAVAGHLRVVK